MASKLVDPADNAETWAAATQGTPVPQGGLIDPADNAESYKATLAAAQQAYGGDFVQGGTSETASGYPAGTPKVLDTPEPMSFTRSILSGTIEDPQAKLRYYAQNRFPDDPQAEQRYGYLKEQPVYVGDDGSLYRENVSGLGEFIGGSAAPMVGGTVGGVMGGPGGAALGSAAGMGYRKLVGQALGDEQTAAGNAGDMALEAGLNAGGWKLGEVIGGSVAERKVARDIKQFSAADARALQQDAKRMFGVDLTPAEASNLGSLINKQTRLGMGMDKPADIMRKFIENRAKQVDSAVTGFIGKAPPAATVGEKVKAVGKQALDDTVAARQSAVGTAYRMLNKENPKIPENAFKVIEENEIIREYIDKAIKNPLSKVTNEPRNSFKVVEAAQKLMREDAASLANKDFKKESAKNLLDAREELLKEMERRLPTTYRAVRRNYADQTATFVEDAANDIAGTLAKIKDDKLAGAAKKIFEAADIEPVDVARTRKLFASQGKLGEWDDVLNQWLRTKWQGPATKNTQSGANPNAGANWIKTVYGTKNQRAIMKEAMGPERFATFQRLVDVLEATARVPRGQSMTQPAQEAAKQELREAAPMVSFVGDAAKFKLGSWWAEMRRGGWNEKLATAITSPDSLKELEKLKVLKGAPTTKAAIEIVTTALTKAGVYGPKAVLEDGPPDAAPPLLQQQSRK